MLMPRKVKHRKQHRGRTKGQAKGATTVTFGDYGIQALEPGWITARQIEAARIAMTRHIKRGGKVWINVFPDKPVTEKPAETRMGSGKGNPERWVAVVKPGRILFELSYNDPVIARAAIDRAIQKLPIKAQFVDPGRGVLMAWQERGRDPRPARRRAARAPGRDQGRAVQAPVHHVTGQLDNYAPAAPAAPGVARINTELRAREIAAARETVRRTQLDEETA